MDVDNQTVSSAISPPPHPSVSRIARRGSPYLAMAAGSTRIIEP
ncbi:hypothetical protein ADINL_0439 [Nitrincola lacisaponensis]|uniref:Uncharacterized protein n=1 Tax=Nitrincola lacisaponensis TaxID=267850 RepID=A0A063Y8J2_9GAMM|nr:hypothetical protein ADINL_0439 [Nitrincola lacisaponensis]